MSGQHPSEWASARCPLARGRAAGRGTPATSAFIPPGTGRVGAGRAFSIPRGWRLGCVSALGRAERGFYCGFSLLFFFPRRFLGWETPPRWDSRGEPGKRLVCVCLSVC